MDLKHNRSIVLVHGDLGHLGGWLGVVEPRIGYHALYDPDRAGKRVLEAVFGLQGSDGDGGLPLLALLSLGCGVRLMDEPVVDR